MYWHIGLKVLFKNVKMTNSKYIDTFFYQMQMGLIAEASNIDMNQFDPLRGARDFWYQIEYLSEVTWMVE